MLTSMKYKKKSGGHGGAKNGNGKSSSSMSKPGAGNMGPKGQGGISTKNPYPNGMC